MDQNSLSQMESSTIVYEIVPSNYENHIPIQIYEILTSNPKLITFNNDSYISGLKPSVPIQILGNLVGKGAFGQVYKVLYGAKQIECALKIISKCELEHVYILIGEFQIQKYIGERQPQCIIQIIEKIIISQQQINEYTIHAYLDIAEYSLWELMQKKKLLSEKEINEIFDSVLDSILNLHSCKVSHGDIKPQNILFEKEKGWVLADFGCAIRYSQPFGKYKLGGTKAFFPLDLRNKLQNLENLEQDQLYMNLFNKDIYAFQLTILFLLYPEKSVTQLQKILDQNQPIHYLVDLLYNKNYITLKQWFKSGRNYQRMNQKNKELMQNHQIYQLKQQVFLDKEDQLRKYTLEDVRQKQVRIQNHTLYAFTLTTQNDQKFKYNITQQLLYCKFILENDSSDVNKIFKLYEAKLEFILGNFSNSRQIINNLNDFDYMDNDELFLQFQILKSRLNGYWWKICDKMINSLQNVINLRKEEKPYTIGWEFLLMGHLEENLRIKNKRKNKFQPERSEINREWILQNQIDHCWEIKIYYNSYLEGDGSPQYTMEAFEKIFPNYYFNWMIYYLETEHHIYKDEHQQAKSSALKAFNYTKDETCIVNKFRVQFHLWIAYLNLKEVDNCNEKFTMILKQAQQKDAPQLFKEYFFYFSVELYSIQTISRSIGFFQGFLEQTFLAQNNLINDNKLNLFFFQMLSKYYIFEKNSTKLKQLINTSLIKFYQNNPKLISTIIEEFDYLVFSQWDFGKEFYNKSITELQKLQQMKFIFTDLDFQKTNNQFVNEKFEFKMSPSGNPLLSYSKQPCKILERNKFFASKELKKAVYLTHKLNEYLQ